MAELLLTILATTIRMYGCDYSQDAWPEPKLNPDLTTIVLQGLVDPHGQKAYDKRVRPNYGGTAVDVLTMVHVSSISAVSDVDMVGQTLLHRLGFSDYTIDVYLRQFWNDHRLAFKDTVAKQLIVGVEYIHKLWVPDTFFPNEKRSFFHDATSHNSFVRLTPGGNITVSQRLTVTAVCPMELKMFPLDSQQCTLEIESYGYSQKDIHYKWDFVHGRRPVTISEDGVRLPTFKIRKVSFSEGLQVLDTGNYSRLFVHFVLGRQLGFYLIQIYLPASLIVITSWVSFWLSREAVPARVSLGVTTVLTMTTLMTASNSSLPKVSYVKSIDIFMICCFLMVFASLLEFAAVGSLNRRVLRKMKEVQQVQAGLAGLGRIPIAVVRDPDQPTSQQPLRNRCRGKSHPESEIRRDPESGEPSEPDVMKPSSIDKAARILFPASFAAFNTVYWTTFLYLQKIEHEE